MFKYLFSVVCASLLTSTAMAQFYVSPTYRPAYGTITVRPPLIVQNGPIVIQNRLSFNYNYNYNNFNSFNSFNYNPYYSPYYNPQAVQTQQYLRWRFLTYGY